MEEAVPPRASQAPEHRAMPRWVVLCAVLMVITSAVAVVDGGSLALWLHSQGSVNPMTLSELRGLAAAWGLLVVVPWAGLVGAVLASRMWHGWEKTVFCLSPVLLLGPAALLSFLPWLGVVASAAGAVAVLAWMIVTGLARARTPAGQRS